MRTIAFAAALCVSAMAIAGGAAPLAQHRPGPLPKTPWVIAHRGASAYAPENTVPAFRLAAEQRATFVEFDLRLTKDRHIVCLHDDSLERTTNVEEVFPDRARTSGAGAQPSRRWLLEDFTLAELRRLDAGSWFDASFRGAGIPTFAETIAALRGRAGLFIELKSPERYEGLERMVLEELERSGLDRPGADPRTPVLIQSFTASSLEVLTNTLRTPLPVHFLFGARDASPWISAEGLQRVKGFAAGISPEKTVLMEHPDVAERARKLGLLVTPYTFRSTSVPKFPDVTAEMRHYLETFVVDGLITDNPDRAPVR